MVSEFSVIVDDDSSLIAHPGTLLVPRHQSQAIKTTGALIVIAVPAQIVVLQAATPSAGVMVCNCMNEKQVTAGKEHVSSNTDT